MKRLKLYSESEAVEKTGFTIKQLDEKVRTGNVKCVIINGKKYYRLSDSK